MKTNGVDLSSAQPGVNYNALKAAGVQFAIIRAGYAVNADRLCAEHVSGCKAAGIDYGFYWYSYAESAADARREAAACVKVISQFSTAPSYPVFFDAEENYIANAVGREVMTDIAFAFINAVEESGYPSGLYANPAWIEYRYDKSRLIGVVDLWLADWTYDPEIESRFQYGQTMWQWGSRQIGRLLVDADISFIDYPKKTAEWYAEHNKKSVHQIALEVINGDWGNGIERAARLRAAGYDYNEVQAEVNRILAEDYPKKSVDEIAVEVIRGKWGAGVERKALLEAAGYNYQEVQDKVNEILYG